MLRVSKFSFWKIKRQLKEKNIRLSKGALLTRIKQIIKDDR